jgi:putative ABC transport system substrate-binding protein
VVEKHAAPEFPDALAGEAQVGEVYRIGVLHLTPDLSRMEAFRNGLSELDYIEGQHIAILDRLAEGQVHRLRDLAAELVRLKVDVIVTGGATTTYAAKQFDQ